MSDLNKKNINYGALNRFYQDLKSHDLSDLNDKIDNIDVPEYTAGSNIQINGNVISATDTKYTAGTNISINGSNKISCTYTLPTAADDELGGVMIDGNGLSIDDEGVLSVDTEDISDKVLDVIKAQKYDTLPIEEQYLTFEATEDNCDVKYFTSNYISSPLIKHDCPVEVSTDLINWTEKMHSASNGGTLLGTINTGEKLYVRGNNVKYTCNYGFDNGAATFKTSNGCYIYGNIMSLINKRGFETLNSVGNEAFAGLFLNSVNILSHPTKKLILSATIVGNKSYYSMFKGCSSLTTAPELPATTLSDNCYYSMFSGCTSLNNVQPDMLPSVILSDFCYTRMFMGCTSLTNAPELPATTLTNYCYYYMFSGCTSLNYVKCLANSRTELNPGSSTDSWLNGVAENGTFVKDSTMTWDRNSGGIPSGWTVQDYVEPVEPIIYNPIIIDESTFTGATLTVDGTQPSIVASGSTAIVWDDLAASIPSGKSVEVSVVLINTGNSALTPTMSGNVQMMGDGNLTIQASELGLYRGRYISALNKWLIEAIYQEVSGIME